METEIGAERQNVCFHLRQYSFSLYDLLTVFILHLIKSVNKLLGLYELFHDFICIGIILALALKIVQGTLKSHAKMPGKRLGTFLIFRTKLVIHL